MPRSTDIRIESVSFDYEDHRYRCPIKFGGVALDRVTLLNAHVTVRTEAGQTAIGFGSMPLGNIWSFPSRVLTYDDTLGAMKAVAEQVARIYSECREVGHPIDLFHALEEEFYHAAGVVTRERKLAEPIPKLCTLVVASPFDAAVHDAFGKVHGLNCYHTYGPEFLAHEIGHYLGDEFRGLTLDRFVRTSPQPRMPLYHL
ncbi:MAG TPA: hypothetical protein VKT80_00130, partial [Chloroflexota bacterium]|nr:hypothetical protein [Chloroflexota bacterium]